MHEHKTAYNPEKAPEDKAKLEEEKIIAIANSHEVVVEYFREFPEMIRCDIRYGQKRLMITASVDPKEGPLIETFVTNTMRYEPKPNQTTVLYETAKDIMEFIARSAHTSYTYCFQ